MTTAERNRRIAEIRYGLGWTFKEIGETFGIRKQRVHQICKKTPRPDNIIRVEKCSSIIITEPMSASEVEERYGISAGVIRSWVFRGHVKVVSRPDGHAGIGKLVLLDPATLQERINKYLERRHNGQTAVPA